MGTVSWKSNDEQATSIQQLRCERDAVLFYMSALAYNDYSEHVNAPVCR